MIGIQDIRAVGVQPSAASPGGQDGKVGDAARQMEGVFLSMLVEEMLEGTSIAEAGPVYSGLITQQLGESLADAGGVGLADRLERDLGART